MNARRFRGRTVTVSAVVAVAALATALLLITATTAGASKTNSPAIQIQGNTYANTSNVTGTQVALQTQFGMSAQIGTTGAASGWFEYQQYSVAQDGTLTQVAFNNVKVQCLSADKNSGTVWFSGTVTAGNDTRIPADEQAQEQSLIAADQLILFGRLRDTNNDGSADQRSLFVTQATMPEPNAYLSSADNNTIANPWWIGGNATSPDTACLLHDTAFQTADYQVVDGPTNQVQWLTPDDSTTVGSPFTGTAANLSNPPTQSVYSLASINRTVLSPTLYLKIH